MNLQTTNNALVPLAVFFRPVRCRPYSHQQHGSATVGSMPAGMSFVPCHAGDRPAAARLPNATGERPHTVLYVSGDLSALPMRDKS